MSFWAGFFAGIATVYVVSIVVVIWFVRRALPAPAREDKIVCEEWFNDGGEVYRWTADIPFSHVTRIADRVKGGDG